jgi:metal-responsive CopG/Arc/MetJ family transcriptional regulator
MTRILLSLPDALLQAINTYCITHHYNRSEFMRHAARLLVDKKEKSYAQFPTSQVAREGASATPNANIADVQA